MSLPSEQLNDAACRKLNIYITRHGQSTAIVIRYVAWTRCITIWYRGYSEKILRSPLKYTTMSQADEYSMKDVSTGEGAYHPLRQECAPSCGALHRSGTQDVPRKSYAHAGGI